MKVLHIGNSLTLHGRAPQIGWNAERGMAASADDLDFVHRLQAKLREAGKNPQLRVGNSAAIEREPENYDINAMLGDALAWKPDVVVIQLSENNPADKLAEFIEKYAALVDYFSASRVYCVGPFWHSPDREAAIEEMAAAHGAHYISLNDIQSDEYRAIGLFEHGGVAAHPGDLGMEHIARHIFDAMKQDGLVDGTVVYPIPDNAPEGELSGDYRVMVDGKDAPVQSCRVSAMSFNRIWPGQQRPIDQSELASLVHFDMKGSADISVEVPHDFTEAVIRPQSKGIELHREGNTLYFTVAHPCQLSLEIDGRHHNLHIFADEYRDYIKEFSLDPSDEKVIYFGAGYHEAGEIVLNDGMTLYVDGGAIVSGYVHAAGRNIKILGHGIIDYSKYERHVPLKWGEDGLVNLMKCDGVDIDGVILRDASWWTITAFNCVNLHYNNVKTIGMWRYNSDGFDFVNSQNVQITNCFLRNFDDVIVFKGLRIDGCDYEKMNLYNYLVQGCTVWCDWGGGFEFGAETVADEYSNIVYRDCDIIRVDQGAMRIHSGDRAEIHNVLYDNIRIEYSRYDRAAIYQQSDEMEYQPPEAAPMTEFIRCWMYCGMWSKDMIPGHVHDITYRNIRIIADSGLPMPKAMFFGCDREHTVDRVTLDGIYFNGEKVKPDLITNEFTGKIEIL